MLHITLEETLLMSLTRTCHEAFTIQQISTKKTRVAVHCCITVAPVLLVCVQLKQARRYSGVCPLLCLVFFAEHRVRNAAIVHCPAVGC